MTTTQEQFQEILDATEDLNWKVRKLIDTASMGESAARMWADHENIPRRGDEDLSTLIGLIVNTLENRKKRP